MHDDRRRAVAARLRALADRTAACDLDADGWEALEDALAAAMAVLPASLPERTRFDRGMLDGADHPIGEGTSAAYPPFDHEIVGDTLVARTTFGPGWEGPPGLVHGGFLAAGFDMVLSSMAHHVMGHSVTRRLEVRYLKPTFLGAALRYEVVADEPRGRLLELRGQLFADDRVTMRARAQFASLDQDRFADRRTGSGSADR